MKKKAAVSTDTTITRAWAARSVLALMNEFSPERIFPPVAGNCLDLLLADIQAANKALAEQIIIARSTRIGRYCFHLDTSASLREDIHPMYFLATVAIKAEEIAEVDRVNNTKRFLYALRHWIKCYSQDLYMLKSPSYYAMPAPRRRGLKETLRIIASVRG